MWGLKRVSPNTVVSTNYVDSVGCRLLPPKGAHRHMAYMTERGA